MFRSTWILAAALAAGACRAPCPTGPHSETIEPIAVTRHGDRVTIERCARPCEPLAESRPPRDTTQWKTRRIDRQGNLGALPSRAVIEQMDRCDIDRIRIVLLVCIDVLGEVTAVDVVRASRFAAWDRQMQRFATGWRYQPFERGGHVEPVCLVDQRAFTLDDGD